MIKIVNGKCFLKNGGIRTLRQRHQNGIDVTHVDLRAACNRSRIRHDRFSDTPRSARAACNGVRAFPPMIRMVCRAAAGADANELAMPSHRDALQAISSALLGIWRAFAVIFFSLCALAQNGLTVSFVCCDRRLQTRAVWLHRWCRFACCVLGIRVTTRTSMPSAGLLVSNHLSYLDIVVLSSIRSCVFVAKRDVAEWPLFGWLAHAAGTIFVDRERRFSSPKAVRAIGDAIAHGLVVVI